MTGGASIHLINFHLVLLHFLVDAEAPREYQTATGFKRDAFLSNYYENRSFPITKIGLTINRISGSLSAISSFLVILVILRSSTKISTTYHRFMLCLSVSDIAASVGITLTTLPMPKPKDDQYVDLFNYAGKRIGNRETCTAQGFIIFTGLFISFSYHVSLWVYYLCTIRYKMDADTISRRVEPYLHLFSITVPPIMGCFPLARGLYNPVPDRPTCNVSIHPEICVKEPYKEFIKCTHGSEEDLPYLVGLIIFTLVALALGFLVTVICMCLIFHSIFSEDKRLKAYEQMYRNTPRSSNNAANTDNFQLSKANFEKTKIIAKQCASYLIFWILTWLFPILNMAMKRSQVVLTLYVIFTPLQGFWSFIIFSYNKVYTICQSQRDCTYFTAFKMIFTTSRYPEILVTNLTLVKGIANLDHNSLAEKCEEDKQEEEKQDKNVIVNPCSMDDLSDLISHGIQSSGRKSGSMDLNGFSLFDSKSALSENLSLSLSPLDEEVGCSGDHLSPLHGELNKDNVNISNASNLGHDELSNIRSNSSALPYHRQSSDTNSGSKDLSGFSLLSIDSMGASSSNLSTICSPIEEASGNDNCLSLSNTKSNDDSRKFVCANAIATEKDESSETRSYEVKKSSLDCSSRSSTSSN